MNPGSEAPDEPGVRSRSASVVVATLARHGGAWEGAFGRFEGGLTMNLPAGEDRSKRRRRVPTSCRGVPHRSYGMSIGLGSCADVCAFALPAEQAQELDGFGADAAEPVRYTGVELGRLAW
jgi:hypothetical protein